jgi:hypothetical protein
MISSLEAWYHWSTTGPLGTIASAPLLSLLWSGATITQKRLLSLSLSIEMFSHKVCIQPTNLMGLVFHRFGLSWFFFKLKLGWVLG